MVPWKVQRISCYFGLWPQNTLGQLICRIFYFWLVWLVFWWKFPCQQKVFFKIKKQVQLSLPQQYLWRIGQFVEIIFFILDSKNPKQKVGTTQVITNNEFYQTVLSCSCLITINVFWLSLTSKATLVHWFV